jgi:hypothetical protein
MLEVAPDTRRQGQRKGQVAALAAKHGVSQRWLRLIAYGTLDDPAFVQAIREAAKAPHLWELVAPAALNALVIPTSKIERLGGSLDDLLGMFLDVLQNSARQPGAALTYVNQALDLQLEFQLDAEADRGRRSLKNTDVARQKKSENADDRAARLLVELERRKGTKAAAYIRIADAETKASGKKVTPDAVEQAIKRYLKKPQPPSQSTRTK